MHRGFSNRIVIFIGLLSLSLILGIYHFHEKSSSNCENYGKLAPDFYLNKYIVQEGDTLLAIAQNQMGSSGRVDELIALNNQNYPTISIKSPNLEIGWKLYIPPASYEKSSGILGGVSGKVTKVSNGAITINLFKDKTVEQINYIRPTTSYLGKTSYSTGDCVYIINDKSARVEAGVVAISPQDKNYFSDSTIANNQTEKNALTGKCNYYGYLDKDFYLSTHIVQKGENVASIAEKELGDSSRTNELIALNQHWYPHLSVDNPFIEVGWDLRLPPELINNSSGYLIGYGGEIMEKTDNSISINLKIAQPPMQDGYFARTKKETKFIGNDSFQIGDCVYAIEDTATTKSFLLLVTPQDKNYFK